MKTKLLFLSLFISYFSTSQQTIEFNKSSSSFSIENTSISELTFSSRFSDMQVQEVNSPIGDFIRISSSGCVKNSNPGTPEIPQLRRLIEIPSDATVSIDIISFDEEIVQLNDYSNFKIIPSQASVSKSTEPEDIPFVLDQTAYNTNDFSETELVSVEHLGKMRGTTIGSLVISPFKYNPITNELIVTTNVTAKITFNNIDFVQENEKMTYTSPLFNQSFTSLINRSKESIQKDQIVTYPTKYVIVSDPMFEDALKPFVEWKTKKGYTVIEAYTNEIEVGNTTSSIKSYLENLYNSGTTQDPAPSFVLFVGDIDQIPSFSGTTGSHVTDLYYCEYDGGSDYFPEVYYGRLSANNLNELQPQLDKILNYEQYQFPSGDFLENVVLVAGEDGNFASTHGNGQINYGTSNYFNPNHDIDAHVWLYPETAGPVMNEIMTKINEGASLVNYSAHCGPSGWSGPSFTTSDVDAMTNNNMYPTMIGNCCQSNSFNYATCFGEKLLRAENKGALGYIGGTNYTYWDEDYYWGVGVGPITANPTYNETDLGVYDCSFHSNNESIDDWFYTQGQIIFAGNMAVTQGGGGLVKYYWEVYHLMGDPSVTTYMGVPDAMSVNHVPTENLGVTTLLVDSEEHAYVAVSQNGVLLDAQYTGTNTDVNLSFPAITSSENLDVVVTKQDRQPYVGSVMIGQAGLNEASLNDLLLVIFPNPSTLNHITVTIENNGKDKSKLTIRDIQGRIVSTSDLKNGNNEINIEALSDGTYFAELTQNSLQKRVKFIKN
ncbi:MAG: C25 family cysteine peptidase [Crocinitomicaceae bacterium]|nr:C25 family cysteine peptidase [Crocinitomicaceae bacterium]